MRAPLCSLALIALVGCGDAAPSTVRANQAEEDPGEESVAANGAELRELCASTLGEIALAHDLGGASNADVTIESHASGLDDCADFAWARAVVRGSALVSTGWAGPTLWASAWDCNHSTLEYAVYRSGTAGWQFVGGALAYGALSPEGVCGHSVNNPPTQDGEDVTVVLAEQELATEVRVGLRAWSHNDTAMGHPGSDCADPSCYWPVRLSWREN